MLTSILTATADEETLERRRGGPEVEEAASPVGTVSVGGEGHECCFGIFAHNEGGVRRSRENAPEDRGEDEEGEEGGPGPP